MGVISRTQALYHLILLMNRPSHQSLVQVLPLCVSESI